MAFPFCRAVGKPLGLCTLVQKVCSLVREGCPLVWGALWALIYQKRPAFWNLGIPGGAKEDHTPAQAYCSLNPWTTPNGGDPPSVPRILLEHRRHVFAMVVPVNHRQAQKLTYIGHLHTHKLLKLVGEEGDHWEIHINLGSVPWGKTPAKENILATAWLPLDLDFEDHLPPSPHELLLEIAWRGLPLPTLVYRTPSGGYRVLYRLERPIFFDHGDSLRRRFTRFFEKTQSALCDALGDLGADRQAIGIHHLFRIHPAELVYYAPENRPTLTELYRAAAARRRETKRKKATPTPRKLTVKPGLESALKWIDGQVFKEGTRNAAFLAYLILRGHAGRFPREEEALDWARRHTNPPYPQREAKAVYKCARAAYEGGNFYGISPTKLQAIGMPSEIARAATQVKRKHQPSHKPTGMKQPKLHRLLQLMEEVTRQGIRSASARKLAKRTGIPFKTLTTTLAPVIKLWRGPGEGREFFDINKRPATFGRGRPLRGYTLSLYTIWRHPRDFLFATLKALFQRRGADFQRTIRFWARREPELWIRLLVASKRLAAMLAGVVGGGVPPHPPAPPPGEGVVTKVTTKAPYLHTGIPPPWLTVSTV